MAALKTLAHGGDVREFISTFADTEQKKADGFALLDFMQSVTGYEPKMWGGSIIGFGQYHYKSERSRQEGDWPLVGFSPRKAAISLYVFTGLPEHEHLLEGLGKFKRGQACLYVNKLSDIHLEVLTKLISETIRYLEMKYGK